ncbi:MAG: chromate efflux transporter [Gemmataceae bacterium]
MGFPHMDEPQSPTPRRVSFGEAFLFWLKLGFISFGGPAGQIAIMHRELVERRRWFAESRFLHALNYCMVLPGPEAQQLATYLGWLLHGVWGGIVAGGLFILPSVFVMLALSWLYAIHQENPVAVSIFWGMKAAVFAVVLSAVVRLGRRSLRHPLAYVIAALAGLVLITHDFWLPASLSPYLFPAILLTAASISYVATRTFGVHLQSNPHKKHADAIDETPLVELPPLPTMRFTRQLVIGLLMWIVPIAMLFLAQGRDGLHFQMGMFFTGSALITFGGAYAVLPYVRDAAVETFGWLRPGQMVDGLALGETTPGPLIMVVSFVGFVGGWQKTDGDAVAACLGFAVAVYFTFLPSFLFILLGSPFIERMRGDLKLHAFLSGITAAIVGVIANLAFVFGRETILPNGAFDAYALSLAAVAFGLLQCGKIDMLWIVLGCGAIGIARILLI